MRLRGWAFALLMLSVPVTLPGADIYINVTTTIAMQDFYDVFIICNGVPAASCNQNALLPLIIMDNVGSIPALPPGTQDKIHNVNLDPNLWSGYIGYLGLAQGSSSDVVVALTDGLLSAGSPWPFATPESQIAADLLGGSPAQQTDLRNFFLSNLPDFTPLGSLGTRDGTFWEFSNAVNVGSLQADVPEPSTMPLAGLAFGAWLLRGRRRNGVTPRAVR